ncbi:uncharacterized protein LOC125241070 [Leguminivora glycinivorella]|uniref:uncharacterized protein LOC125241070 n=1 Tax=Leguminivora glycinivorella TaxID=1035111 RepID=UPI0020103D93|nr:uncharacterized protein LOC125241070 [Leguminivora glycinivorella]
MAKVGGDKSNKNTLSYENQDIIRNIFEKCKYESVHGLQRPLELYRERVLYYTDTTEDTLNAVIENKTATYKPDLFERAIVNDTLKTMYSQQESFSFNDIYEKLKDKIKAPNLNEFCRAMKQLGYRPISTNYGHIIFEEPKVTYERYRYLRKITKLREGSRAIYYIDERIIDLNKTFKKPFLDNEMKENEAYVYFHIVSKNGIEKGLFCNQGNAEDFSKWISDIVLSHIKASSVIVMDNSPLHGQPVINPISGNHTKTGMINWLQRNNIPCSSSMRKAELYDLISRCPVKDRQYQLDLIFQAHGHEVLRLPKNYHDLSMTELLWEHILSNTLFETTNVFDLKNKVHNAIAGIRQEKWLQFESIIKDTEENIFSVDEAIEQALDAYEIDAKDVM